MCHGRQEQGLDVLVKPLGFLAENVLGMQSALAVDLLKMILFSG